MITWPDKDLPPLPPEPQRILRSIHRRRPRWPLVTLRRARWAVAVQLCHSRPFGHAPDQPEREDWRQGSCAGCWEDADAWLSSRV